MTRRPAPHEPARDVRRPDRLRDDARANPACLGCGTCPDHATCGGLHTEAPVFDCDAFCMCRAVHDAALYGSSTATSIQSLTR